MPMETVDLVQGQQVDKGFDLVDREEMTTTVEHRPAVSERGSILDLQGRKHCPVLGKKLAKALKSVEDTC